MIIWATFSGCEFYVTRYLGCWSNWHYTSENGLIYCGLVMPWGINDTDHHCTKPLSVSAYQTLGIHFSGISINIYQFHARESNRIYHLQYFSHFVHAVHASNWLSQPNTHCHFKLTVDYKTRYFHIHISQIYKLHIFTWNILVVFHISLLLVVEYMHESTFTNRCELGLVHG